MQFRLEVEIDLRREKIIEFYFNDKWVDGFISKRHISGEHGAVNSPYKMKMKIEGQDIEFVSTILKNELPESFSSKNVIGELLMKADLYFEEITECKTKFIQEHDYYIENIQKDALKRINRFKSFAMDIFRAVMLTLLFKDKSVFSLKT